MATVLEYQSNFEEISIRVTGLDEHWLVSFFVAGLQEHLKCELLLAQPNTYYQVVSLAKLHEQKANTVHNSFKTISTRGVSSKTCKTFQEIQQLTFCLITEPPLLIVVD